MLKETLQKVLTGQALPAVPDSEVPRLLAPKLKLRREFALVLTGIRRCGKSTLQGQLMRESNRPFYCNFDDIRLAGMTSDDFALWLEVFNETAGADADVFLDEVQEVEGWQRLVRTLLDAGRRVCVTGSNASLLGHELGAKLTGRHESRTVWPFCYSEYLTATGQERGVESLQNYLSDGGFPAYLRERRDTLLNDLLRDVLLRDVMVRHRLRETRHLNNLFLYLSANIGLPVSLQKLTKNLEIPAVTHTSRYVEYLQDAYLLFALPKYSPSFRARVVAPPKYYAIDTGLLRAVSPQAAPDRGRRLENALLLDFLRRGETPSYAAEHDAWECDFVTGDTVWQACWQLNEENTKRETRGLLAAKAQTRAKRMVILTAQNHSQTLTHEGEKIEVIPAWEWLG
ncbi:MAG: ATP-binding protein [Opitutaceae bacterium]|jgi:predicted AAA+ superfamily ATPase|nr:ATP-binding protein [Opitutaceae bacterium]